MFFPYKIEPKTQVYRQSFPYAVGVLLAAMVLIHAGLSLYASESTRLDILYRFGVVKFDFAWWSLLTCTLLHGGWGHLLGNAWFLWVYGACLERVLGTGRFLMLYVIGAVASVAIHLATLSPFYVDDVTIGASGAISAVLGAFFVLMPTAKLRCALFPIFSLRPYLVDLPAWLVLIFWLIGQLIHSLHLLGEMPEIAFWAHVGGFAAGAVCGTVMYHWDRRLVLMQDREQKLLLVNAWSQFLTGAHEKARASMAENRELMPISLRGSRTLLEGMLGLTQPTDSGEVAAAQLLQAFCHARDNRQDRTMLGIYRQMLLNLGPERIPAVIHRDAAFAANNNGRPGVALFGFRYSLADDLETAEPRMALAIRSIIQKNTPEALPEMDQFLQMYFPELKKDVDSIDQVD